MLEAVKSLQIKKLVYAASSSCYGIPDSYPTREGADIRPQYPYAFTKWVGEQSALHWGKIYSIPTVSLRLFNVFGPRSRTSGTYGAVFGVFLAQKRAGKPLTIVGDGSQKRDFTNVRDVANAFYLALISDKQGIFNVGTSTPVSVNKIAEIIGGEKVYIPKRPGEPDSTHADISKIVKELNWKAQISIEEGVSEMLTNIDDWKDAPVWDPESIDKATKSWFKFLK